MLLAYDLAQVLRAQAFGQGLMGRRRRCGFHKKRLSWEAEKEEMKETGTRC